MALKAGGIAFDEKLIQAVESAKTIVTGIREIRNDKGIKNKDAVKVVAQPGPGISSLLGRNGLKEMISKMANLESLELSDEEPANAVSFLAGTDKFYVVLEQEIDTEEECQRLQKEQEYLEGFVRSVEKKLSNEGFVGKAPAAVVEAERKKLADGQTKLNNILDTRRELGCL